ncbi:MAG TPA: UDP-glucose--hexose-1-phosphate uridylyltransferase [Candidatus Acidoferrum sp.]|jgi:UDPglucose--hexose-1-phosphate uridylyltransferase
MNGLDVSKRPHRRYNPLTREWILVSPHRMQRPWQGQTENITASTPDKYDPACYMCPGNARSTGPVNPAYQNVFVFDNDFPAVLPDGEPASMNQGDLLIAEAETGICRVVCFSPRHDLTLSGIGEKEIRSVIDCWDGQFQELGARAGIQYVQIFENHGALMGASNPHPHGQIWATSSVPMIARVEQESQISYKQSKNSCLLCDYCSLESAVATRIVAHNEYFLAVVPYWAVWPFETMLISKRHLTAIDELDSVERDALGNILKRLTSRYDNLFQTSFPYSMGFHQRPTDGQQHPEWHFHAHFFPPLLRSASVRKFMVGFELLGMPQRDITAELSAAQLRAASETPLSR